MARSRLVWLIVGTVTTIFVLFVAVGYRVRALIIADPGGSITDAPQFMWFVGLGAGVLAGGAVWALNTYYQRRLGQLTRVIERNLQGEFDVRALPLSQDGFGVLARSFSAMTDQLRETIDAVRMERRQLEAVLNNMADGVLILDDTGRLRLANPAAARILNTNPATMLGKTFAEVTRHHDFIELWHTCRELGEEQVAIVEMVQGGTFLQMIITPHASSDGEATDYVVLLQDLTQIQRLRTVRRDFISNISHELRTPLASLKALVETLRDAALDDPPAAQRFLDRADREVDALTQMVEELLELSRIESGQVPFHMAPTSCADLLLPSAERLLPQAERNGVELVLDVSAGLPQVWADADRVMRVVTNLVHNALKFTPTGGRVTIQAYPYDPERKHMERLSSDGPHLVIEVRDTGAGIPSQDLPRIFERFFKADRARTQSGGTGLGLAIARHIVQNHGGEIWVRSRPGQGSRFFFTLPVVETEPAPVAQLN